MTTNYDPIAEQYQRSKQQPWRTHIEAFSLMEMIGDPTGLSVLDMACGEGFYTRMIRQKGAAVVTGVDLSDGMINLARKQEVEYQLGIDYLVSDARNLNSAEKYDLVVAAYLLNYSQTRSELQEMCDSIARCLKPRGRFVTINSNPGLEFPTAPSYRKYGFETSAMLPWQTGTPITWTFHLEDGPFEIENYYLDIALHEEVLTAAGFREVRLHPPKLSSAGKAAHDHDFWNTFLNHPPVALIECLK
ncbi:MAG: SAM-dependent methyltransferase [Planctomycetaceae bacterium]|nr:SAM-dependent methyltransferase [Planctomycetaceae bacterium]